MRQPIPFGKYYLLERINVGGMAEVFKAKATGVEGFERMVAVKRILPSIAEDEEFITMFIDEAKIAVQLTHATIAQIFDLGRVDDSYFIALEYVHGKDMRAIFNRARSRSEQIPVPMACYIIMKLCEGLDYAHNKRDASGQDVQLVHRDVSPQNILVSYEGEVKIIDFGIAKAAGKAGRTQAGILKGKFGYMSPEQVQGFEIDRRSDVFGVGICLYELLTGERLFIAETDFATLEKVRNVDIMPPSTYNRRIPEELEQIVLKALARDRDLRHQTAMQLHDELQAFMYGSGNFFGRRDLSMYMHRAFAEELERESARDQEYAALSVSSNSRDEGTGLNAFDEIDPVSVVSALHTQPEPQPHGRRRTPSPGPGYAPAGYSAPGHSGPPRPRSAPPQSRPPAPAPRQHKQTLLGLPAASLAAASSRPPSKFSSQPAVPPLVPRPQSIPPGHHAAPRGASATVGGAAAEPPRLDMDWDDEELSTQIYDRPEDRTPANSHGSGPQQAVGGSGPYQQASGSFPPNGVQQGSGGYRSNPIGEPPGAPSPFGQAVPSGPAYGGHPGASTVEIAAWPQPGLGSERRPMLAAVLAVVAIIGAIVAALLIFRAPSVGAVQLHTTPTDATVAIDGKPVVGSSPFVINDVVPGVAHEIVVRKAGFRDSSTRFELQSDQADKDKPMELPAIALEALESGFALDSVPSAAAVFVDGQRQTQTTPVRVTALSPGDHLIRLEADGYAPWESSLHVTPGTVLDLPTAQLIARAAEADQRPAPKAAPVQKVPVQIAAPAPKPPRPRALPSEPRPQRPAPERSGPEMAAAPEPEPEPEPGPRGDPGPQEPAASGGTGTLRVQTRPWSKVFADGKALGNTPLMNVPLSAGKHTLLFVNDDFGIRKTVKVQIEAGQVLTQVLTLTD